ncbi:hypothetical protein [Methanosarcina horonobensis]|nr:hypothetical protein [Methanosarcina horonobensis]
MSEESSGSSLFSYKLIVLILLGAAGIFIYRIRQKKIKEKNAEGNLTDENQMEEEKIGE